MLYGATDPSKEQTVLRLSFDLRVNLETQVAQLERVLRFLNLAIPDGVSSISVQTVTKN